MHERLFLNCRYSIGNIRETKKAFNSSHVLLPSVKIVEAALLTSYNYLQNVRNLESVELFTIVAGRSRSFVGKTGEIDKSELGMQIPVPYLEVYGSFTVFLIRIFTIRSIILQQDTLIIIRPLSSSASNDTSRISLFSSPSYSFLQLHLIDA